MKPRRWQLPVTWVSFFAVLAVSSPLVISSEAPASIKLNWEEDIDELADVIALRWAPAAGKFFVHAEKGKAWHVFDHQLRLITSYPDGSSPDLPPSPKECQAAGEGVTLQISGPGRRKLTWKPKNKQLHLSASSWESTGTVQWGPGWATVEFRCTQNLGPWIEWQDSIGQRRLVEIKIDAYDSLVQRAYLQNVAAGAKIRLRNKPIGYSYPPQKWTDWIDLEVPEVDPAAPRPTSSLLQVPSARSPAERPR
jgi:hypothetical protein